MKILENNGHKVALYASAEEMPIKRYNKFQKYLLVESGVGSDVESAGRHLSKLFEFIGGSMKDESLVEAKNLFYNFYMIQQEENLPAMALACLVASIDEEPVVDLSEENLKVIVEKLSFFGFTQKEVKARIDEIKKKIASELKRYVPSFFNSGDNFEFFANVKRKALLLAEEEETGVPNVEEMEKIDRYFLEQSKPHNFDADSEENAVLRHDLNYESLCAVLENNGVHSPQNLSTMQFYHRLEYFKKQAAALSSAAHKHGEDD